MVWEYMNQELMLVVYLQKTHPVEADLVVGVPESGNPAALGYSMESGIPYGNAL